MEGPPLPPRPWMPACAGMTSFPRTRESRRGEDSGHAKETCYRQACHHSPLSFLRRDCFDLRRKLCMSFQVNWPVLHLGTRRVCPKEVVAFPVLRRSDWPGSKPAAAVWADVAKEVINTCG